MPAHRRCWLSPPKTLPVHVQVGLHTTLLESCSAAASLAPPTSSKKPGGLPRTLHTTRPAPAHPSHAAPRPGAAYDVPCPCARLATALTALLSDTNSAVGTYMLRVPPSMTAATPHSPRVPSHPQRTERMSKCIRLDITITCAQPIVYGLARQLPACESTPAPCPHACQGRFCRFKASSYHPARPCMTHV
jgi:hypothetical protein